VAVIDRNLNPGRCMAGHDHAQDTVRRYGHSSFDAILLNRHAGGRPSMFEFRDLFQWDRFITPTIIKTFYWLVMVLMILVGVSGVFSGLAAMAVSPFGGFMVVLSSLVGTVVGIILSRIAAEFILIVFRINEHLGAIRDQGQHQGH
jgi:hypothetical protein